MRHRVRGAVGLLAGILITPGTDGCAASGSSLQESPLATPNEAVCPAGWKRRPSGPGTYVCEP